MLLSFINRLGRVLQRSFGKFNENRAGVQGAALSFFMVFALPPLLVMLVMVATLFLEDAMVREFLLNQARRAGGATGLEIVKLILGNVQRPEGTNVFAGLISFG